MTVPLPPDREFIDFQEAVAGHYSLERELGRGGMGIVFLARELRLARPVAIKVLPRALASARPELRQRFVREAQMAAQLSHPNIVPIHHVDEAGEFVFFVMAYIEGETLGERLRSRGAIPAAEASRIFRDVGWAIAYAHLRGIVHRDIKPDNILLERGTGRALVTDFGIAGDLRTPSTADGDYVRGTVHFLSPEQAAGAPVDGRSDLYSLGVTAYYALTGRLPFDAASPMGILVAHASQKPVPIVTLAPGVPHRLAAAVERCLEKRPELRWESGERFAEAVDAAIETPRELPAPLRVWTLSGERRRGLSIMVLFYGASSVGIALGGGYFLVASGIVVLATGLLLGPAMIAARRLAGAGFSLEDARQALATHVARRREELVYESTGAFSLPPRRLAVGAGVMAAAAAAIGVLSRFAGWSETPMVVIAPMVGAIAVGLGVIAALRHVQLGRVSALSSPRLKFWQGRWGERLFRLAGLGTKPASTQSALPQHTEVALGRALDVLFESLPRETRRALKDVPVTVRRLEDDARKLREAVDALDDAVAAATRAGQPAHSSTLAAQRDVATRRLATVVTALETIRLGLLRLQIGAAPVTSVTEAIDAAVKLGRAMEIAAESESEAAAALKRPG